MSFAVIIFALFGIFFYVCIRSSCLFAYFDLNSVLHGALYSVSAATRKSFTIVINQFQSALEKWYNEGKHTKTGLVLMCRYHCNH